MSKIKIIYDWKIFQLQSYGGVSRYIVEIAKRLSKNNVVEILPIIHINQYLKESSLVKSRLCIKKFKYSTYALSFLTNAYLILTNKKYYCDILHKTYYYDVSFIKSKKNIVTVHDMIHELYPQLFNFLDKSAQNKAKSIRQADHIICVSKTTKRDLIKIYSIDDNKVTVIYNGITKLRMGNPNQAVNFKFKYLLYVGHRNKYKNFDLLLKCYVSNPCINKEFKLVCFGGGSLNSREISYIKKYNLKDRVLHISGEDGILKNLYENAFLLVHTSLYEGFGFTPLEAMDNKCMVIASDTEISHEILGNSVLYFDPYSVLDLKNKILLMLNNPDLCNDLRMNWNTILEKYKWEDTAKHTLLLYKKILND
jgi:glycosyltransferase involved in cell wall biosynthesis